MRKFLYKSLILIGLVAWLATACDAPIDVQTNSTEPRLVIFAAFSQDTLRNYVNVSKSMPYFEEGKPIAVNDARVSVTYRGNQIWLDRDTLAGRYFVDNLPLVATESYVLDVFYDFDGDGTEEHYMAKSIMPNSPRVDSVRLSSIVIEKMPILFVYGQAFHTTENNFCLYNWHYGDTIGMFDYFMLMPEEMMKTSTKVYPLPYFVSGNIHKGDTLCFRIDNLNNQYTVFISQAASETGIPNPLFSNPPAEVYTNIKCLSDENQRVSGIFTTYSRGKTITFISDIDFSFSMF